MNDSSITVVSEAVNCVFDYFAEPENNQIYVELKFHEHLNELLNSFSSLDPTKYDTEDFERLEESMENLQRFLEYKANQF